MVGRGRSVVISFKSVQVIKTNTVRSKKILLIIKVPLSELKMKNFSVHAGDA